MALYFSNTLAKYFEMDCYCGLGRNFDDCCRPIIFKECAAPSPEALMRSRYSAFCTGHSDYLLSSWHDSTRPSRVKIDADQTWVGLSIRDCSPVAKNKGEVEFVAKYKLNGKAHKIHELSRFVYEEDNWFYLDGKHFDN